MQFWLVSAKEKRESSIEDEGKKVLCRSQLRAPTAIAIARLRRKVQPVNLSIPPNGLAFKTSLSFLVHHEAQQTKLVADASRTENHRTSV